MITLSNVIDDMIREAEEFFADQEKVPLQVEEQQNQLLARQTQIEQQHQQLLGQAQLEQDHRQQLLDTQNQLAILSSQYEDLSRTVQILINVNTSRIVQQDIHNSSIHMLSPHNHSVAIQSLTGANSMDDSNSAILSITSSMLPSRRGSTSLIITQNPYLTDNEGEIDWSLLSGQIPETGSHD